MLRSAEKDRPGLVDLGRAEEILEGDDMTLMSSWEETRLKPAQSNVSGECSGRFLSSCFGRNSLDPSTLVTSFSRCPASLPLKIGLRNTTAQNGTFGFLFPLQQPLTFIDLLVLAKQFTSKADIYLLGTVLGVPLVHHAVLDHENNITEAAYRILLDWRRSITTDEEARRELIRALRQCRLQWMLRVLGVSGRPGGTDNHTPSHLF